MVSVDSSTVEAKKGGSLWDTMASSTGRGLRYMHA
jgi:hypothetical protein